MNAHLGVFVSGVKDFKIMEVDQGMSWNGRIVREVNLGINSEITVRNLQNLYLRIQCFPTLKI